MSIAQSLPKDVAPWCLQKCPICGRDNYMMVLGEVEVASGVRSKCPDEGYSFCNCHNIFYTKDAVNPIIELERKFNEMDENEITSLTLPDPFFVNWDSVYEFTHWEPRKNPIIWDIESLEKIMAKIGFSQCLNARSLNVHSDFAQTSNLIFKKPPTKVGEVTIPPRGQGNKPTKEELMALKDYDMLFNALTTVRQYFLVCGHPGLEHYRLLAWWSHQVNNARITEIGTMDGCGLLALAHNPTNEVYSYDIAAYSEGVKLQPNAHRLLVHEGYMDDVCKSSIIHYDAEHLGKEEREFVAELEKRNWKGILLLDDIHLLMPMYSFWMDIKQRKEDWTDIGHDSGTGVVYFE